MQGLATEQAIFATRPAVENPESAALLAKAGLTPVPQSVRLKGVAGEVAVYEIP